jgi:uncharacterized membrane protein
LTARSRDLSLIAVFAALYAVLVYLFSPISFYAFQFRVAGILRPSIARKWVLAVGYGIGVVVGNIFSPFVGPFELVFMPIMSFVAGIVGYIAAKPFRNNYFVAGAVVATIVPVSVSWMLNQLFNLPMIATFPYLFISEQIVCLLGASMFKLIETRFKWW